MDQCLGCCRCLPQVLHITDRPQVLPVPCRDYAFQLRVGAGRVGLGRDALLGQGADVPILLVGHAPKLDRAARVEVRGRHCRGMEEPVTDDPRSFRRQSLDPVDEYVVGKQAQKHVRVDRVVLDTTQLLAA